MSVCPSREQSVPCFSVQDVFRVHGPSYERERGAGLSRTQKRVLRDIRQCRTEALGGHLYRCDTCGHEVPLFNSCRNRHCPNCQGLSSETWSEQRKAELLPVQYFHNVFTLPHEFNDLALANKAVIYKLLFDAVSHVLLELGRERLHGTLGLILVLHTWDQLLRPHIHLHCLIPGGALSFDRRRWNRPLKKNHLFSVEEISEKYKERFLELVKDAYKKEKLVFPGSLEKLENQRDFDAFLKRLSDKDWVVYSKPSYVDQEQAISYLSRYTHRVAISNSRILDVDESSVTISYIDRKDSNRRKEKTLEPDEFLGRFMNHVLPSSFHRIRYYGLFNNRMKRRLLPAALLALGKAPLIEKPERKSPREWILERTGEDIELCPECRKGHLTIVQTLPPWARQPHWRIRLWLHNQPQPSARAP